MVRRRARERPMTWADLIDHNFSSIMGGLVFLATLWFFLRIP